MGVASLSFYDRSAEVEIHLASKLSEEIYAGTFAAQLGWPHEQAISVSLLPASLQAWLQYLSLVTQLHGRCAHFLLSVSFMTSPVPHSGRKLSCSKSSPGGLKGDFLVFQIQYRGTGWRGQAIPVEIAFLASRDPTHLS
jgi:hypothetical protein